MQRIREMEQCLDHATKAVADMEKALADYQAALPDIAMLSAYLNSDERRRDLADDERGLLPHDLKRGVLSEDGIWNLLERDNELRQEIQQIINQNTNA